MAAKKFPFQLPGAARCTAGAAHDAARHDLTTAQRHAFAGVAVADGVSQPRKHPCLFVHKGQGAHPRRGIPHPHTGTPLPGGAVPCRGHDGAALLSVTDKDYLHCPTLCCCQSSGDLFVALGGGAAHAHHPVSQMKSRLFGGVYGVLPGVQVGKTHDQRTLRKHFHSKGGAADLDLRAGSHHRPDPADRQPASQCKGSLVAAHGTGACHIPAAYPPQRFHPAKPGQGQRLLRFQPDLVRQAAPQPAQRRKNRCCQIHGSNAQPAPPAVFHSTLSPFSDVLSAVCPRICLNIKIFRRRTPDILCSTALVTGTEFCYTFAMWFYRDRGLFCPGWGWKDE